jgi:hypothetical protein
MEGDSSNKRLGKANQPDAPLEAATVCLAFGAAGLAKTNL